MKQKFIEQAKDAVKKAIDIGAGQAEVYIVQGKELSIDVRNNEVETMKLADEIGLGVRVFKNQRLGYAFTSDLSQSAIDKIIHQAIANSDKTTPDEFNRLPDYNGKYKELDLYDHDLGSVKVEEKIELAKSIEKAARDYDARVKITERSSYFDAFYEVALANSLGINATYRGTYCGAYSYLVAEENGDNQTGFGVSYQQKFNRLKPEDIGREAAENAVRMLGAKSVNTQKAVVVLDPNIATDFLSIISPILSAEAVQKGKSLFAGKVGQEVGSHLITIIDDGTMEGGIRTAPFDGEGVPTSKNVLVENGVLKGFLHNTYTAAKEGIQSTGNGNRGSYKNGPEIGTTNFYIAPGNVSREELLKNINQGLYITDVMGMHTANPISGDFSVGASGLWIENGKFTKPVKGIAIAGNIIDLLESVDCVSDDLRFFGGKGSPTIRIAQMSISGS